MDADDSFEGNRTEGEGIPLPKVIGCREGKFGEIIQARDILGLYARFVESHPIVFRTPINVIKRPLQPFQLERLQLTIGTDIGHEGPGHFPRSPIDNDYV
jgi:hypothetical protein